MAEARSYHHGDLRSALLEAGLGLARQGGAEALGLRVVTRSVGVSPNAAYRHFADRQALVLAVAVEAQGLLAAAMREEMAAIAPDAGAGERALGLLRGVGTGYIRFALTEPGWFELAILTLKNPGSGDDPGESVTVEDRVPPPYQLLLDALDAMVDAGVLTPERRVNAEWLCWSTVHGFADLATRGPLYGQEHAVMEPLAAQVVDRVIEGLVRAG
ncbi:TetR/AcrR family transcriptional regulator [Streptomyces yaizuensis]|uniref:TetR/AcrR family transcriptional regulator n=1 Tax=Streptomyces yaizuensis TaxID=2989713 RepID=A0ABQ5P872_9ACTN|nr:TetR/AcrR family transcriptional regulator [Streptomyces sp. YSPA8]GLF98779.1 TetR/AcrR family transcriptional regulator [Streptomyces sp. YSPA8]